MSLPPRSRAKAPGSAQGKTGTALTADKRDSGFRLPSPAARFIAHLILQGHDDDKARSLLRELALDEGDAGYIARFRRELALPKTVKNHSQENGRSREIIESLGLVPLIDQTVDAHRAMDILKDRRARELAETLIISGAPEKAIAGALRRIQPRFEQSAVSLFQKCFFDVSGLTRGDLRVVLELRVNREVAAAAEESAIAAAAVQRRWRSDPRRVALELPQGAPFAQVGLLAAGLDVQNPDPAPLLRRIRDRAILRAMDRVHRPNRRDALTGLTYLELALRTTDLIERVQDPQVGLLDQLRRVVLKSAEQPVPTLHELAGDGQYTTEVAPVDLDEPRR